MSTPASEEARALVLELARVETLNPFLCGAEDQAAYDRANERLERDSPRLLALLVSDVDRLASERDAAQARVVYLESCLSILTGEAS